MIFVGWMSSVSMAQDIHYSQPQQARLHLSPAQAGLMPADFRVAGIYRMQWETVPVQYRTFGLGFDMKIMDTGNAILGGGLQLARDQAGDSQLSLTHINLSLNGILKMGKNSLLSLGLGVGMGQRSFDSNSLTFDNQFNGDVFDPDRSTGESFEDTNFRFLDLGAGINYRWQKSRRLKFDIGLSGWHFNRPNQSFLGTDDVKLPIRINPYLLLTFPAGKSSDILIRGWMQSQNPYREYVMGMGWRYHISQKKSREVAIAFSSLYRFDDAIIPTIELQYGSWTAGLSYDINISEFNIATGDRGGPEISLVYLFTKVKPMPEFKACPIF